MAWYLVERAAAVCAFIATFVALCVAAGMWDYRRNGLVWLCLLLALAFAVGGCLLVGFGWSEARA